MYVFLDFDGVLRRKSSAPFRLEDDLRERFELAVRPLDDAKIVISSTWRLVLSLSKIRRMFSPDVASLIVGCTPDITDDTIYQRYDEVMAYLSENDARRACWVAIDDDRENFPGHAPVIITDANMGFSAESAQEMWKYYAQWLDNSRT